MLEAAKYSCTKRDSRSESPLPSDLRILSTTCCLSDTRSHRQTLAVAPLPRGFTGVKPWMPADLSTASASARRRASARAIMLGLSTGGSGCVDDLFSWLRHRLDVGRGRPALGLRAAPCGGAFTSISAGGLWRTGFGQHAHDLREVRLGAQLRQPQQAFLAQVLIVDEQVRVAIPAEIRRWFAVGGEVVHFQLGGGPLVMARRRARLTRPLACRMMSMRSVMITFRVFTSS